MTFCVTFEFLNAVTVKITASGDVTTCCPLEIYQSSVEIMASIFVALSHAENSNSKFLRNVGKFKQTTWRHNPADSIMKLFVFLTLHLCSQGFR